MPNFERFTYRQGQLLTSRDFRDQQQMEAARRWMHNTSEFHNAWGVAIGYEFLLSGASQELWQNGGRLILQPGIAYDYFGRELILSQAVTFNNVPDLEEPQKLFLVASYQETSGFNRLGAANTIPFPPPRLQWKPEREVNYGPEVPILFVTATEDGLQVQPYSASQLHPQARPKIASGQTVPGQTAWRAWTIEVSGSIVTLGLEIDIDTTDAGFQQTPCYFAWLNGPLSAILNNTLFLFAPFISLANEKPDGFIFRVFFSEISNSPASTIGRDPIDANRDKLTVCWLGIEAKGVDLQPANPSPPPPPID